MHICKNTHTISLFRCPSMGRLLKNQQKSAFNSFFLRMYFQRPARAGPQNPMVIVQPEFVFSYFSILLRNFEKQMGSY